MIMPFRPHFLKLRIDSLKDAGLDVIGVGKIPDIFVDQGITRKIKTVSNEDGMNKTIELASDNFNGLAFINLVDFDGGLWAIEEMCMVMEKQLKNSNVQ